MDDVCGLACPACSSGKKLRPSVDRWSCQKKIVPVRREISKGWWQFFKSLKTLLWRKASPEPEQSYGANGDVAR